MTGLNPTVRVCHYVAGGHFSPHCDGAVELDAKHRSIYTVNIYLADVSKEQRGTTNFLKDSCALHEMDGKYKAKEDEITHRVQPRAGMALVFFQANMVHEGEELAFGDKYLFRTDIMYEKVSGTAYTPQQEQGLAALSEAEKAEGLGNYAEATRQYKRAYKLFPELEHGYS
eukprot:m.51742 g.51742  ORF g.51742 m.51742 type:complete len:171 (-) comp18191_c0_seq2:257-769(-)